MAEPTRLDTWLAEVIGLATAAQGARNPEIRELVRRQPPIQPRHLKEAQQGSIVLAAKEDPNEAG